MVNVRIGLRLDVVQSSRIRPVRAAFGVNHTHTPFKVVVDKGAFPGLLRQQDGVKLRAQLRRPPIADFGDDGVLFLFRHLHLLDEMPQREPFGLPVVAPGQHILDVKPGIIRRHSHSVVQPPLGENAHKRPRLQRIVAELRYRMEKIVQPPRLPAVELHSNRQPLDHAAPRLARLQPPVAPVIPHPVDEIRRVGGNQVNAVGGNCAPIIPIQCLENHAAIPIIQCAAHNDLPSVPLSGAKLR